MYNALNAEYSDWVKIDTIKKGVKKPPRVINYSYETKINKDTYPIIKTYTKVVFDFWFIFPIYKTVNYDKIASQKVIEKKISKKNSQF